MANREPFHSEIPDADPGPGEITPEYAGGEMLARITDLAAGAVNIPEAQFSRRREAHINVEPRNLELIVGSDTFILPGRGLSTSWWLDMHSKSEENDPFLGVDFGIERTIRLLNLWGGDKNTPPVADISGADWFARDSLRRLKDIGLFSAPDYEPALRPVVGTLEVLVDEELDEQERHINIARVGIGELSRVIDDGVLVDLDVSTTLARYYDPKIYNRYAMVRSIVHGHHADGEIKFAHLEYSGGSQPAADYFILAPVEGTNQYSLEHQSGDFERAQEIVADRLRSGESDLHEDEISAIRAMGFEPERPLHPQFAELIAKRRLLEGGVFAPTAEQASDAADLLFELGTGIGDTEWQIARKDSEIRWSQEQPARNSGAY